jgi:hypothetical protein
MAYLNDSEKKYFTVSDHLLGHPSVGLTKYFADPLLSYCFQEADPIYVSSQFNDLHREDTFDSDIWNNKECFTEEELEPFRQSSVLSIYYIKTDDPFEVYEHTWLEDMFNKKISWVPLKNATIAPYSWFLVQRPHLHEMMGVFQYMEQFRIPFHVIHLSDEFGADDISFYSTTMCKSVLRNYLRPDLGLAHVYTIPLGYHHRSTLEKSWDQRDLAWSFHGTDWFDRSTQLREFVSFVPYSCHLQPNWNHPTATTERVYLNLIGNSKFCPILKGQNSETFRMYEALEAGCLPVTTITDPNYLKWIEENMDLSSLYNWTQPASVLANQGISEETRLEVGRRWNAWKERIRNACSTLFK